MKYLFVCLTIVIAMNAWVRPAQASFILNKPSALGLNNGLVGWWTFDGKDMSGVQAYDRSGNGNRGILTTGPVPGVGRIGQALRFDGADDYVDLGNPSSLDLDTNFTIMAWVKVNGCISGGALGGVLAHYSFSSTGPAIRADCEASGNNLTFRILATGCDLEANIAYIPGNWYHVAMVVGAKGAYGMLPYVNGQLADSTNFDSSACGSLTADRSWTVGLQRRTPANCNCNIDDVRIYNRVLSADEIKRLYNIGGTVKLNSSQNLNNNNSLQNGLVGWWTFDGKDVSGDVGGATPQQIYDRSGSGNVGKYYNATGTPPVIGKLGQGMQFDGSDDYVAIKDPGASSILDFDTGQTITMSVWARPASLPTTSALLAKGVTDGAHANYTLETGYDVGFEKRVFFCYREVGLSISPCYRINSDVLSTGTWTHIAFKYTFGTPASAQFYINGTAMAGTWAQGTGSEAPWVGNESLWIGQVNCCGDLLFQGTLDDVRVYNRALSADEIKRLYNIGGTVKLNSSQNLNNNNSLQNGLVGWWTFDGKDMAGNYAFDKSGNGNRGTLTGGPVPTIGKIGQGLDFHSSNSQVNAGTANVLDNMTTLSFAAWIYPRSLGGGSRGTFFDKASTGNLTFRFEPNANIGFVTGHATNMEAYSAYNAFTLNQWQHVVMVWNGSLTAANVQFYRNGVLLAHKTADEVDGSGNYATDGPGDFLFGFQAGNTRQFDGIMDDVRLYNRTLSADDVKRLYNMGR